MNEWFKIGAFILLLFVLTAEDCSNNNLELSREDQTAQLYLDLENKFEKEQLQPEELAAFEKRSVQMLADLVDYINIYADSSLSKEFRLQSRQMITEFFIKDTGIDSLFFALNLVEDIGRNILLFDGSEPFQLKLASSAISENLSTLTDRYYSGRLEFALTSNITNLNYQDIGITFKLQKSKKQFGEKGIDVWGIYFGQIIF